MGTATLGFRTFYMTIQKGQTSLFPWLESDHLPKQQMVLDWQYWSKPNPSSTMCGGKGLGASGQDHLAEGKRMLRVAKPTMGSFTEKIEFRILDCPTRHITEVKNDSCPNSWEGWDRDRCLVGKSQTVRAQPTQLGHLLAVRQAANNWVIICRMGITTICFTGLLWDWGSYLLWLHQYLVPPSWETLSSPGRAPVRTMFYLSCWRGPGRMQRRKGEERSRKFHFHIVQGNK